MDNNININLPDCIDEPIKEGLTPISKSVGTSISQTFSTCWELVFGGLECKLEKLRYKRKYSIEEFKKEFNDKVQKIPPENLVEAEISVFGPTLEASKYYFEKEDIRKMFLRPYKKFCVNRIKIASSWQ